MSRRKVKGHTEGKRHLRKISIGFDLDTFNYICNMAEADNTSFQNLVLYLLTMDFHKKYRILILYIKIIEFMQV